jgi:hypothetical protein
MPNKDTYLKKYIDEFSPDIHIYERFKGGQIWLQWTEWRLTYQYLSDDEVAAMKEYKEMLIAGLYKVEYKINKAVENLNMLAELRNYLDGLTYPESKKEE